MRKNLAVDIPKDADTEVQRVRGLKKSIFTRTRIALLCLVMVISLSVVGTFAYEKWNGNTVPNRTNSSDVELHIVENINGGATAITDQDQTGVNMGYGNKKVYVQVGQDENKEKNRGPEKVRVSFIPECESAEYEGANVAIDETNAAGKWGEVLTDTSGHKYISNDVLKLYIADDYSSKWDYDGDGTFTYKTALKTNEKTETLLYGVDFVNASDKDNYGGVKVNVIADAIQETAADEVWTAS